jgi:hypothetical protein
MYRQCSVDREILCGMDVVLHVSLQSRMQTTSLHLPSENKLHGLSTQANYIDRVGRRISVKLQRTLVGLLTSNCRHTLPPSDWVHCYFHCKPLQKISQYKVKLYRHLKANTPLHFCTHLIPLIALCQTYPTSS